MELDAIVAEVPVEEQVGGATSIIAPSPAREFDHASPAVYHS
jgi:hypothetical protein